MMQSAAKVGGLVILCAVLVLGILYVLQKSAFSAATVPYSVVFTDAGGLISGSRVTMSGVNVGTVQDVSLEAPGRAVAKIAVEEKYKIPAGSLAVLPSNFISVGDKELQIMPGGGSALAPNAEIPGSVKSAMQSLMPDTEKTMAQVNDTLKSVQNLLEDKELKGGLKDTLTSSQRLMETGATTAEKFGNLASRMDGLVANNQAQFKLMLRSTAVTIKNMEVVSTQIKDLVAKGEFQNESMALLKSMNEAVKEGRNLVAEINKMATDPELQASIKQSSSNVTKMTESGTKIAKDFESISQNGIEITKQTSELMTKANKLADQVGGLVEAFKKTVDKLRDPNTKIVPEIHGDASILGSQQDSGLRTDVNFLVPIGKEKISFGLYDAFESNKINFQLQKTLDKGLDLRYGVYASKPGLGVDYHLAPNLFVRGDLFGLNDTRFDTRLRMDFGRNLQGWLGLERVFQKNTPVFGLGIKW